MSKVDKFEDLLIWQRARDLSKEVYKLTFSAPFKFDSRFVQQIRAAAGSVMDNIAEGFERDGNKEFVNFLYIAKGSCGEVRSQLYRAKDVGFITEEQLQELHTSCIALSRSIAKFIISIKTSSVTGLKNLKPETVQDLKPETF